MLVLCHESLRGLDLPTHRKLISFILATRSNIGFVDPFERDKFYRAISSKLAISDLWKKHLEGDLHHCQMDHIEIDTTQLLAKLPSLKEFPKDFRDQSSVWIFVGGEWFDLNCRSVSTQNKTDFWLCEQGGNYDINLYGGTSFSDITCHKVLPDILFEGRSIDPLIDERRTTEYCLRLAKEYGDVNKTVTVVNRYLLSNMCASLTDSPESLHKTFVYKLLKKVASGSDCRHLRIVVASYSALEPTKIEEQTYNEVISELKRRLSGLCKNSTIDRVDIYFMHNTRGQKWKSVFADNFIYGTNFDLYWHHFDQADFKVTTARCKLSRDRDDSFRNKIANIDRLDHSQSQSFRRKWSFPEPDFPE